MESIDEIRGLYIEPDDFDDELDNWQDLWDDNTTLYQNYYNIIRSCVILPWEDELLPVVTAYICTSAKWSKILPVMLCWGLQGSGKSTLDISENLKPLSSKLLRDTRSGGQPDKWQRVFRGFEHFFQNFPSLLNYLTDWRSLIL
jgi:hypothetical protein